MLFRSDKTAKSCEFKEGNQVLVLLPVQGSSLTARYTGPHMVQRNVSDTTFRHLADALNVSFMTLFH